MILERDPKANYGFFGYEGAMVDRAISMDEPADLKECIERGWIDKDSRCLNQKSIVGRCREKGDAKCEKELLAMGWN